MILIDSIGKIFEVSPDVVDSVSGLPPDMSEQEAERLLAEPEWDGDPDC